MLQLSLRCCQEASTETCAGCGQATHQPAGYQVRGTDTSDPICPECAREHAPALLALVNLARTAERVTRIGRNSVFPPLSALLDLASAAEKYTTTMTSPQRKAS